MNVSRFSIVSLGGAMADRGWRMGCGSRTPPTSHFRHPPSNGVSPFWVGLTSKPLTSVMSRASPCEPFMVELFTAVGFSDGPRANYGPVARVAALRATHAGQVERA